MTLNKFNVTDLGNERFQYDKYIDVYYFNYKPSKWKIVTYNVSSEVTRRYILSNSYYIFNLNVFFFKFDNYNYNYN